MILNFTLYLSLTIFSFSQTNNLRLSEYSTSRCIKINEKFVNENTFNSTIDTTKTSDSIITPAIHYVIAGSFLVPKNAETQLQKLKKLGFNKSYKYNFPETEYYSVVVDTFKTEIDSLELTDRLQKYKIDYFIKRIN